MAWCACTCTPGSPNALQIALKYLRFNKSFGTVRLSTLGLRDDDDEATVEVPVGGTPSAHQVCMALARPPPRSLPAICRGLASLPGSLTVGPPWLAV